MNIIKDSKLDNIRNRWDERGYTNITDCRFIRQITGSLITSVGAFSALGVLGLLALLHIGSWYMWLFGGAGFDSAFFLADKGFEFLIALTNVLAFFIYFVITVASTIIIVEDHIKPWFDKRKWDKISANRDKERKDYELRRQPDYVAPERTGIQKTIQFVKDWHNKFCHIVEFK